MLDMLFLIAAIIGGTVMICQFLLTLMGMGDDGGDMGNGDFSGDADVAGDFDIDADLPGDHHTPMGHAADADYQHPDSTWLFGVLSFRTLIAAAAFFGVAGKTASRWDVAAHGFDDRDYPWPLCHVRHVLPDARDVEARLIRATSVLAFRLENTPQSMCRFQPMELVGKSTC